MQQSSKKKSVFFLSVSIINEHKREKWPKNLYAEFSIMRPARKRESSNLALEKKSLTTPVLEVSRHVKKLRKLTNN